MQKEFNVASYYVFILGCMCSIFIIFSGPLMTLIGIDAELATIAQSYNRISLIGLFAKS